MNIVRWFIETKRLYVRVFEFTARSLIVFPTTHVLITR